MRGASVVALIFALLVSGGASPARGQDSTAAPVREVPPRTETAAESSRVALPPPTPQRGSTLPRAVAAPRPETTQAPFRMPPPGARPAKTTRMCGVCHPDVRVKFDKGIHKSEEIGCTSCHGGDPNALTLAAAHGPGFRGKPRRRDIPGLCGSCHSDVTRMRPYNLPSDQLALYKASGHGIALAKGDESVAVCTDCHGSHEIRPPSDPQSSVALRNIPATCGKCHGDAALMARHGIKTNAYADYKAGVHGKALLLAGNDAAPQCASCHSSHGAAPPGVGYVDKVCGQCHAKTRTFFLASVHRGSLEEAGRSECAVCHYNHKTAPADERMFDTTCRSCHDGEPEARVGQRMKAMLVEASTEIRRARGLVSRAAAIPLYVEDYQSRLEDARTALLEAVPVTHTLDTTQVEPHTRRARSIASEVSREIDEKLSARRWRYVGLGLFWFYLLLTAAIVMRSRRHAVERNR